MLKNPKIAPSGCLSVGRSYRIVTIKSICQCQCRHKLLAMGLTPDSVFRVVRKAPFGDPVEIEIKGFLLALRARELASLELKEVL